MEKLSMEGLNRPSVEEFKQKEKLPVVIILDNVRSGLNIGSAFRTADAFAVEKIILCGITAQPPHREILKTALGSTDSVDWQYVGSTVETVCFLQEQGYKVFAVEQANPKTWLQDFSPDATKRYAFVFGNEVEGVAEEVLQRCDGTIEIPQFGTKHSLNIAVTVGIVLWEVGKKLNLSKWSVK